MKLKTIIILLFLSISIFSCNENKTITTDKDFETREKYDKVLNEIENIDSLKIRITGLGFVELKNLSSKYIENGMQREEYTYSKLENGRNVIVSVIFTPEIKNIDYKVFLQTDTKKN